MKTKKQMYELPTIVVELEPQVLEPILDALQQKADYWQRKMRACKSTGEIFGSHPNTPYDHAHAQWEKYNYAMLELHRAVIAKFHGEITKTVKQSIGE